MIDVFTAVNEVANSLPSTPIRYRFTQPTKDLPDEFCVINSITLQGDLRQDGVINVNIHVKNLTAPDNSQPNVTRLQELAKIYTTALNQKWGNNKSIQIEDSGRVRAETNNYHYLNIRVRYSVFNI